MQAPLIKIATRVLSTCMKLALIVASIPPSIVWGQAPPPATSPKSPAAAASVITAHSVQLELQRELSAVREESNVVNRASRAVGGTRSYQALRMLQRRAVDTSIDDSPAEAQGADGLGDGLAIQRGVVANRRVAQTSAALRLLQDRLLDAE
jgi:hypothetical protein